MTKPHHFQNLFFYVYLAGKSKFHPVSVFVFSSLPRCLSLLPIDRAQIFQWIFRYALFCPNPSISISTVYTNFSVSNYYNLWHLRFMETPIFNLDLENSFFDADSNFVWNQLSHFLVDQTFILYVKCFHIGYFRPYLPVFDWNLIGYFMPWILLIALERWSWRRSSHSNCELEVYLCLAYWTWWQTSGSNPPGFWQLRFRPLKVRGLQVWYNLFGIGRRLCR